MRVAVVRSDIGKLYTSDVESRVQRDFSAEPPGQSRDIYRPSNAALLAFLNANAILSLVGTDLNPTTNTTGGGNNELGIKTSAAGGYITISVRSDAAVTKVQMASDLNVGFKSAGLALRATVLGTDAIQIDSIVPNSGPNAYLKVDGASALKAALGLNAAALTGLSLAAFKAKIYVDSQTLLGNVTGPFVTTAPANVLKIRISQTAPYSIITVRSNGATTGAQLVSDLNAGFAAAGLALFASLSGAPNFFITINTLIPVDGPGTVIQLDSVANGSTLNNVIKGAGGWAAGYSSIVTTPPGIVGVYIDSTTLDTLSTWAVMQTVQKAAFYTAIRDLIAPRFVETGPVLLSFVYGIFSKMRSPLFQPGGARSGLPPGIAAEFLLDDGSAVFTI